MRPDPADPGFQRFLKEIDDHFVHVVGDLLGWKVAGRPEFAVGSGNIVIRFENGVGERFLFRVPRHTQDQLRRVALAYRHFGNTGIMPENVYMDGKCVLERYVEGQPLSRRSSDAALQALGRTLALVHAKAGEKYGPLSHGTTGLDDDADAYYRENPIVVAHGDDDGQDLSRAQALELQALEQLVRVPPPALRGAQVRLGHGDMWRNNVVVGGQSSISLIDWDRIGCYPREYDFVFMVDADLDTRQKNLVLAAYGAPLEPVLLNWFALRRLMGNREARASDKLAAAARHGLLG